MMVMFFKLNKALGKGEFEGLSDQERQRLFEERHILDAQQTYCLPQPGRLEDRWLVELNEGAYSAPYHNESRESQMENCTERVLQMPRDADPDLTYIDARLTEADLEDRLAVVLAASGRPPLLPRKGGTSFAYLDQDWLLKAVAGLDPNNFSRLFLGYDPCPSSSDYCQTLRSLKYSAQAILKNQYHFDLSSEINEPALTQLSSIYRLAYSSAGLYRQNRGPRFPEGHPIQDFVNDWKLLMKALLIDSYRSYIWKMASLGLSARSPGSFLTDVFSLVIAAVCVEPAEYPLPLTVRNSLRRVEKMCSGAGFLDKYYDMGLELYSRGSVTQQDCVFFDICMDFSLALSAHDLLQSIPEQTPPDEMVSDVEQ